MEHFEVDEKKMTALRGLADINMQIGAARGILTTLQEQETEYLVSREKKAVDRITKVLQESSDLVEETNKNYDQIIEIVETVKSGAGFLAKVYASFKEYVSIFEKAKTAWERDIENQETTISEVKKALRVERVKLDNEKKSLDDTRAKLIEDERKINDDRATLERAIKRLNEGRV